MEFFFFLIGWHKGWFQLCITLDVIRVKSSLLSIPPYLQSMQRNWNCVFANPTLCQKINQTNKETNSIKTGDKQIQFRIFHIRFHASFHFYITVITIDDQNFWQLQANYFALDCLGWDKGMTCNTGPWLKSNQARSN